MDATEQTLAYRIALTQVDGVGGVNGRNLLAYMGSPEAVFRASGTQLMKVPGIGEKLARRIKEFNDWPLVEKELKFIKKNNVRAVFFTDADYPERFKHHNDTPLLFYFKGNGNLNPQKTIGIVGTRKSTEYGKLMTEKLVQDLAVHQPVIISGLAYGIDVIAHKAALANGLQTIGIQGCGLNRIYPADNKNVAEKMFAQGGVLSEFISTANIGPENFALRNRLVAACSDALVIVESAVSGGALITANMAFDYNKEVFAFPGRVGDKYSEGCHQLIKQHKAAMIESANDLVETLGWEAENKPKQSQLIFDLNDDEKTVVDYLRERQPLHVDDLVSGVNTNPSLLAATLLSLELKGAVLALPGKRYRTV